MRKVILCLYSLVLIGSLNGAEQEEDKTELSESDFVEIFQEHIVLKGHSRGVNALGWSPESLLASGGGGDSNVRLWDHRSGECIQMLKGHSRGVNALGWSPEGLLASGGGNSKVRLWKKIRVTQAAMIMNTQSESCCTVQ